MVRGPGGRAGRRSLPRVSPVGSSVDGASGVVVGAVGSVEADRAVGLQGELPASFVDEVVVFGAQRQQVVEVGEAESFPGDDVVDLAVVERDVAVGVGAGAVHRPQGSALGPVGDSLFAPDGECFAVGAEHDGDDGGFAAQPPDGVDRQRDTVRGLTDAVGVEPVDQGWAGRRGRTPPAPAVTAAGGGGGDDFDEGDHGEVFERYLGVAVTLFDGVELGVDRGPQFGAGFGVDFGVEVPHPGDPVDPAAHRRVRLLTVELADAAVTGEESGQVAAVLVELGDRVPRGGGQQIGFQRRQLGPRGVVEVAGGVGQASTWPADTVPSARASSNDGNWSHTAARSAAALASLRERRPQRPNTSAGEASTPGVAPDATRRATAMSIASTHPRTRALNSTMCSSSRRSHTTGSSSSSASTVVRIPFSNIRPSYICSTQTVNRKIREFCGFLGRSTRSRQARVDDVPAIGPCHGRIRAMTSSASGGDRGRAGPHGRSDRESRAELRRHRGGCRADVDRRRARPRRRDDRLRARPGVGAAPPGARRPRRARRLARAHRRRERSGPARCAATPSRSTRLLALPSTRTCIRCAT